MKHAPLVNNSFVLVLLVLKDTRRMINVKMRMQKGIAWEEIGSGSRTTSAGLPIRTPIIISLLTTAAVS